MSMRLYTAAALQDIDMDALAFERQAVTGIHLGDHLDGMPAYRQRCMKAMASV